MCCDENAQMSNHVHAITILSMILYLVPVYCMSKYVYILVETRPRYSMPSPVNAIVGFGDGKVGNRSVKLNGMH